MPSRSHYSFTFHVQMKALKELILKLAGRWLDRYDVQFSCRRYNGPNRIFGITAQPRAVNEKGIVMQNYPPFLEQIGMELLVIVAALENVISLKCRPACVIDWKLISQ